MVKIIKQEAVINWTPPKQYVDELTIKNFYEWTAKYELALVEFYSQEYAFILNFFLLPPKLFILVVFIVNDSNLILKEQLKSYLK
jgi:hypothetical protein